MDEDSDDEEPCQPKDLPKDLPKDITVVPVSSIAIQTDPLPEPELKIDPEPVEPTQPPDGKEFKEFKECQRLLQLAHLQITIYEAIIAQQTKLDLRQVMTVHNRSLYVHNGLAPGLDVVLKDYASNRPINLTTEIITSEPVEDEKQVVVSEPTGEPTRQSQRRQPYRHLSVPVPEEAAPARPLAEVQHQVDENLQQLRDAYFESSTEDLQRQLDSYLSELVEARQYKPVLKRIARTRSRLMGLMPIKDYIILLRTNKDQIKERLGQRKQRVPAKSMVHAFTPLDQRLLRLGKYSTTTVEVDDMDMFRAALKLQAGHIPHHQTLNFRLVCEALQNYSLALFTLRFCLQTVLINPYSAYNIVYVPNANSSSRDPFSFYTLNRIEGNRRYWDMDSRMENLAIKLSTNILPYCVTLFRHLYADVFADNYYRDGFLSASPSLEFDAAQLLQTIILLSDTHDLSNFLRGLIQEQATYVPTKNDKFNLVSDDQNQAREFARYSRNEASRAMVMNQLFDDISTEDALLLYQRCL